MKKLILLQTFALGLFASSAFAQAIVSLSPAFPTANDAVTITYNADQGNGQLANLPPGTSVYAHTGITVDGSDWQFVVGNWGTVDNRVLMTRIGTTNQYTLTIDPSIRSWYQSNNNASATIPGGASITRLCMVFRNATGTLEGKTSTGGDIFVDLATNAFSASITSHPQAGILVDNNLDLSFIGQSSASAELAFTLDGTVVNNASNATSLTYDVNSSSMSAGLHELIFSANNGTSTVRDTLLITRHTSPNIAVVPSYGSEGIIYPNNTTAYLQLRAPSKSFIYVLGDFNDWTFLPQYSMNKTPDGQYFWIEIPNLDPTREYRFQYFIDWEGIRVADPYCEKVLDPWNDQWISETTYPDLLAYPTGNVAEGVVGILQTTPEAYQWDNSYTYVRPPKEDLVIYELLVRDFSDERNFTSVIDRLGYLKALQVNAIQLMPVAEFDGNESWGYAPNFPSAVDKYYGTRNELKRLIDSCHANGIAVISDVVFNHVWGLSPLARMYFDAANDRPADNNPWLNPVAKHPFNVGYDMNHESNATKYFVKKTLDHWMDEYRIDGFRFDLSKGFTQTNYGSDVGAWSQYDQGRVNIIQDYASSMRQNDPNVYIILEHFGAWDEEVVYANNGMMVWGYAGSQYSEAAMGWLSGSNQNLYQTTPQNRGWGNYGLQNFVESHDEERLMFKNISFGNSSGTYNTRDISTALERMGAVAAFLIPLPGPKMMWQFGELGYDYGINYCPDGTYDENCRLANKPVRWDYYANTDRKALFEVYRKLIYLKKTQPSLRDLGHFMDLGGYEKIVRFTSNDLNVVIAGNFDVVGQEMNPGFPFGGVWYDYLTGESIDLSNPGNAFNYAPGEYHVYIDRQITPPANTYNPGTIGFDEEAQIEDLQVIAFPNPLQESLTFRLPSPSNSSTQIHIQDVTGRLVKSVRPGSKTTRDVSINASDILPGIYFYTVSLNGIDYTGKLIKQ